MTPEEEALVKDLAALLDSAPWRTLSSHIDCPDFEGMAGAVVKAGWRPPSEPSVPLVVRQGQPPRPQALGRRSHDA